MQASSEQRPPIWCALGMYAKTALQGYHSKTEWESRPADTGDRNTVTSSPANS